MHQLGAKDIAMFYRFSAELCASRVEVSIFNFQVSSFNLRLTR